MKFWYCLCHLEIVDATIPLRICLSAHLTTWEEILSGTFDEERKELGYRYGPEFEILYIAAPPALEPILKGQAKGENEGASR